MNPMRHLLLFVLYIIAGSANSQQIYVHGGMNRSAFLYEDSEGKVLEGMDPEVGLTLGAGLRLPFKPLNPKWFYTVGLVYEHYGMRGTSPDAYQHYYEWRTTYLGPDLGVECDLFTLRDRSKNRKGMTFFIGAAVAPEFLIKGAQTIDHEVYDLRGVEQFDAPFLFLRGTLGVNYCISNRAAIVVDYAYAHGVRFPGVAPPDDEQLAIRTHNLRVGIAVALPNCKYCLSKSAGN